MRQTVAPPWYNALPMTIPTSHAEPSTSRERSWSAS